MSYWYSKSMDDLAQNPFGARQRFVANVSWEARIASDGLPGRAAAIDAVCPELHLLTTRRNMSDDSKPEVKMDPMFLPGVENNPQPGPYADALRMMQAAGPEYPQIWHMFAFKPEATGHLARFTQEIMREPAPLSAWLRELIAAYTSARNHCPF